MNLWMIALVLGLLAVTAIVVTGVSMVKAESPQQISCTSCGGKCTADKNCGSATCGAVTGKGTCGCGG